MASEHQHEWEIVQISDITTAGEWVTRCKSCGVVSDRKPFGPRRSDPPDTSAIDWLISVEKEIAELQRELAAEREKAINLGSGITNLLAQCSDMRHESADRLRKLESELAAQRDLHAWAFLSGAKWWEWKTNGATMWTSDQAEVFAEAVKRYPYESIRERELQVELAAARIVIRELRLRIHNTERHNQFFERCESQWCNPVATIACADRDEHAVAQGDHFKWQWERERDELAAQVAELRKAVSAKIAPTFPYSWLDCTCPSDPLGRCVIPEHKESQGDLAGEPGKVAEATP
jgi:hypothetical protein